MRLKKTIVAKGIDSYVLNTEMAGNYIPKAGDLAIFEVVLIDRHSSLQGDDKRLAWIFEGDRFVGAFADRYATAQFEGYVPDQPLELYDILGAGGVVGVMRTKNASLKEYEPTKVKLIGYCCGDDGKVINTKFYKRTRSSFEGVVPNNAKIILSIGSTMDSGKTTTAAHVARGLKSTGKQVAFIKLTGTAYSKDKDMVYDCGADVSLDFCDMGFPSTYMCQVSDILDMYQSLLYQLNEHQSDYIVMEIADGLLQQETAALLRHKGFMSTISNVVFSCGDSLAALKGVEMLAELDIKPCMISGRFTMSPLLIQEVMDQTKMPVHTIDEIMTGELNHILLQ